MEIYTLTISLAYDENEQPWSRTIEVKENFTLVRLHKYIQDIIEFDNDHLFEFYIGKNPRNRTRTVPKKSKLNEIYPLTGQKLYYLFDFGDDWLFKIKKSRKKRVENEKCSYPRITESAGDNPEQYFHDDDDFE